MVLLNLSRSSGEIKYFTGAISGKAGTPLHWDCPGLAGSGFELGTDTPTSYSLRFGAVGT
jgi:hypothetical protein